MLSEIKLKAMKIPQDRGKKNSPPQIYFVGSHRKHHYDVCRINQCIHCKEQPGRLAGD